MIFVSYSEKDRERVEALVVDLGVLGHNVYFEEKSLGGSQRWSEIFESIEQADAFVYTVTPHTLASYSRLLEYEHALALGKPIIPLRFAEVDLWLLPPGVPTLLDYTPQNEALTAELARVLHAFPPTVQSVSASARPELSFALGQLYRRIDAVAKSPAENAAILLNLREFLERRETFVASESMLNGFAARLGKSDPLADEVRQMRSQLKRINTPRSLFSRRRLLTGLFLFAVAGGLFWLAQTSPMSPILGDPAVAQDQTALPTATVVNLPVELTSEVLANLPASLTTNTQAATQTLKVQASTTTLPTTQPTATLLFSTATSRPATITSQPPTPTPKPPTATHQPPTQPPPTQPPPTQAPSTQRPLTQPPPTQLPPTQVPPTQRPPTQPPPTQVPPTQPPPTQVPPTQPPPTQVSPTQRPPTQAPLIPTLVPVLPSLIPPIIATIVPPIISLPGQNQNDNNGNHGNQGQGNGGSGNSGKSGNGNSGNGNGNGNSGNGNGGSGNGGKGSDH